MISTVLQQCRILIVDDNSAIHEDFKKVLCPELMASADLVALTSKVLGAKSIPLQNTFDYSLSFADRGEDGYALVQQGLLEKNPFDLAFIDMRMPNGWSGMETIQAIWEIQADLPIVLCTAYSDVSWETIQTELAHLDRFFVLKKPFDNVEVQQLTNALIRRQLAENKLKENQLILESAQAIASIGHYTFNEKTSEVTRSKTLEHIFGVRSNFDLKLEAWFDLIDPKDRKQLLQAISLAKTSENPFECVCLIKRWSDQEPRWILASGFWESHGNQLIGTMQDITERYQLQDHLDLLQRCISEIDDVVIIVDQPGTMKNNMRVLFVNEAFIQKTGYQRHEVMGRAPLFINPTSKSDHHEVQRLRHGIAHHELTRVEVILSKKNGDDYWVDLSLTPVSNHEEKFWIAVIRPPSTSGVLNAIEKVAQGSTWVDEKATKKILTHLSALSVSNMTPEQIKLSFLSSKEIKVTKLILESPDLSRKELAAHLNISENTLRNHLASIYEKLDIHTQLELYIFCKKHMSTLIS